MTDDEQKIDPLYYQAGKCTCGKILQTYDYVRHLPYADATAIKYITRHRDKGVLNRSQWKTYEYYKKK